MKCKYCGGEIDKNSSTCPFCGSSISLEEKKEIEQLNKQGCPKCGSTNISFRREQTGVVRNKDGSKTLYQTKGICNDCGHTWTTDAPKRSKTWLWVLGWIFLFPLPLTILLIRKKDMKPALKYGIIAGAWVIYLIIVLIYNIGNTDTSTSGRGAVQSGGNISKIEFLSKEINLDISKKYTDSDTSWVNCKVKDMRCFSYEDLVFISEDPEVATFEYDSSANTYIYFKVTGISAGETYVYVTTKDGSVSSEKIKVTVTGTKPESTPTNTPTPTSEISTTSTSESERLVWISSTGNKYHRKKTCSNMEDPWQVTVSEAEEKGYEPCGKCGG